MATIELSGKVTNQAGTDLEGLTVQLYTSSAWEAAGSVTSTDTTDSDGIWNFDSVAQGTYVVVVNNSDSTKKLLFDGRNEVQFTRVDIRSTLQTDSINEATSGTGVTIDGVLLKDGGISVTADFGLNDAVDLEFGTGNDALMRWSTGNADNHALVLALGQCNQVLHIAEACDVATDWNIAANAADSEVRIHSSTTPATDYITIGRHTGTTADVDVVGGTTLNLQIDSNTEVSVTASGLTLPANSDLLFTGTTGTNDIVLTNALADALSITDGSADIVVIDTSTSGNVTTLTSALTVGSDGSGSDVIFYSGTSGDNLTWDASEEQLVITGTACTTSLNVAAGNVTMAEDLTVSGALAGTLSTASQPSITTIAGLTSLGAAGATTNIVAGDVTMYNAVNNGNPTISLGSASAERLSITANYDSGAQTLCNVEFATAAASGTGNKGKFVFDVDGTDIATIDDGGIDLVSGKTFSINGSDISTSDTTYTAGTLLDLSGTTFNVDLTEASAQTIADGDYVLFLDGGTTGTHAKGSIHDIANLFSGTGLSASSSVMSVGACQTGIASVYNTSLKAGRDADNLIDFATTDNEIILRVNGVNEVRLGADVLTPVTSDGIALGTGSLMWKDLFLASGSVINFNNGNVTLTHSACTLTVACGTLAAAAITGTTIDASTDFTIGTTVITDDVITFTPTTSDTVVMTAAADGAFSLVTTDAVGSDADLTMDVDGEIVLDAAAAEGVIVKINGTAQLSFVNGAITPTTDDDIDLGASCYQFKNGYFDGTLEADVITVGGTNISTATRTIILTAAGGIPSSTNGSTAATQVQTGTNLINYVVLDFATAAEDHASWNLVMPDSYGGGVITATYYWTAAAGTPGEGVTWGIAGMALADSGALEAALPGTTIDVDDTLLALGDVHISPVSGNITLGGSPAGGDWVVIQVTRKVGDAHDDLGENARLLAVKLEYIMGQYSD